MADLCRSAGVWVPHYGGVGDERLDEGFIGGSKSLPRLTPPDSYECPHYVEPRSGSFGAGFHVMCERQVGVKSNPEDFGDTHFHT